MKACRELELKYDLHIPSKKEQKEHDCTKKIDYKKGDLKRQIQNTVGQLINSYKVCSITEFKTLIELYNVTFTEVNGKVDHKIIHGIFYSAINNEGKKEGRQLKSSLFGKEFGHDYLKKKFTKDKKISLSNRDKIFLKRVIVQCLYQCKDRSQEELTGLLKKRGIDIVMRNTKEGRLYGVTFVDHNTKTVFNGSRLGKEFSANVMANFFNNPYFIIPFPLENKGIDIDNSPSKEKEEPFQELGSITGATDFDAEEEAYKRMLRKKRKKGQHKL